MCLHHQKMIAKEKKTSRPDRGAVPPVCAGAVAVRDGLIAREEFIPITFVLAGMLLDNHTEQGVGVIGNAVV